MSVALRWVSSIYAGGTPSKEHESYWRDGTVPWLNSGCVNDWVVTQPSAYITEEAVRQSSAKWIPRGSVLLALAGQGKTKGMAARLEIDATCNQSMAAVVPNPGWDYRYLHYVLAAQYEGIRHMAGGDLRDGLNLQMVGDIRVPSVALDEQWRISDFLDDQVVRIESLIASRRRQSDLAHQALHSETVVRLLGGGTMSADAGDNWFHNVPGDWRVGPLRTRWRVIDCKHRTPTYVDEGYPVVSPGDIRPAPLDLARCTRFVDERDFRDLADDLRRCREGDVVYSRNASAGTAALVASGDSFTMGQDVCRITSELPHQRYLFYALNHLMEPQLESARIGSTFTRINIDQIKAFLVPSPPWPVQVEIAASLDHLHQEHGQVQERLGRSVELLKELQRSLISAAVSGEFDVSSVSGRGVPA